MDLFFSVIAIKQRSLRCILRKGDKEGKEPEKMMFMWKTIVTKYTKNQLICSNSIVSILSILVNLYKAIRTNFVWEKKFRTKERARNNDKKKKKKTKNCDPQRIVKCSWDTFLRSGACAMYCTYILWDPYINTATCWAMLIPSQHRRYHL